MKETSRAKTTWRDEDPQDWDSIEQQLSVQDPGTHAQPKQNRTRDQQAKDCENQRSERHQQMRSCGMVHVMDTLQHAISIIEKEVAKNLTFLKKELDTRNTNNATVALIIIMKTQCQQLSANCVNDEAYHRADQRPVPLKFGTLTTIEKALNTADTKYSVYPVAKITMMSKDRRDSSRH